MYLFIYYILHCKKHCPVQIEQGSSRSCRYRPALSVWVPLSAQMPGAILAQHTAFVHLLHTVNTLQLVSPAEVRGGLFDVKKKKRLVPSLDHSRVDFTWIRAHTLLLTRTRFTPVIIHLRWSGIGCDRSNHYYVVIFHPKIPKETKVKVQRKWL